MISLMFKLNYLFEMNQYNLEYFGNKQAYQNNNGCQNLVNHPVENSKNQFEDLLSCHICFCHVNNPMMCPYCSKLYCEACIRKCIQFKPECPNCRKQIKGITAMANCHRFINQLQTIVNELIEQKLQQQICQEHQIEINYYCQQCALPVCCECQMFGKHQGHKLKRLGIIYQARYDSLRQMLSQLKSKLKQRESNLKQIEFQLNEVKKIKQKNIKELEEFSQMYRIKIIQQTTKQSNELQQQINKFNQILANLNRLEEQLNLKAQEAEKSGTFHIQDQLLSEIQLALSYQIPKDRPQPKSVLQEVIPPFFSAKFVITQFSKKKKERNTIFSEIEKHQGNEWRLKIYPSGNNTLEGNFLSIFVQLVSSIHESTVYQYQIHLINRTNPQQNMIRQSSSTFEVGESWGYNKYIKLQNLQRDGYIDPISDELQITYSIRCPFYYNIYKQKQAYLQYLDNQILEQDKQIKELQKALNLKSQ